MKTAKGFTYIETLMALLIIAIMATLGGPFLDLAINAAGLHVKSANLEESAVIAFARMSREMRRVRDGKSVVQAAPTQFEFVDINGVQIRFRLAGNSIMRSQNSGTEYALADQVPSNGLAFIYYDARGNAIAGPTVGLGILTDIRRVVIKVTFQDGSYEYETQTQIRAKNLPSEADLLL